MKSQTQVIKKYLVENFSNEPFVEGFSVRYGTGTARHWITVDILVSKDLPVADFDIVRKRKSGIRREIESYMESINNPICTYLMDDNYEGYCLSVSVNFK